MILKKEEKTSLQMNTMLTILNKKTITEIINILPIAWLFSGFLLFPNGQTYLGYFLCSAAVFNFFTKQNPPLQKQNKYVIYPVIVYLVSLIISYIYNQELFPVIRTLLYFLVFAISTPLKPELIKRMYCFLLPLTSITISLLFLSEQHSTHFSRSLSVSGLNPIPFATTIAIYLAFHLSALEDKSLHASIRVLAAVACIASIYSLILAETRSALLCALIIFVLYFSKILIIHFKRNKIVFLLIILSLSATVSPVLFFPESFALEKLPHRIQKTKQEAKRISNNDLNTSIGVRFQLWSASLTLIKNNHYLFPIRKNEFTDYVTKKINNGEMTKKVAINTGHVHNQFLNAWLKSGILGLISIFALIITPVWGAIKNSNFKSIALASNLALIIFISSLTDVPLTQISTLQCFLLCTLAFAEKAKTKQQDGC